MVLRILSSDSTGAAVQVTLASFEDLIVTEGTVIGNTTGSAVVVNSINSFIRIDGSLIGLQALDFTAGGLALNVLLVTETGSLYSMGGSAALRVTNGFTKVENRGDIWSDQTAIVWGDVAISAQSELVNSGTIEGETFAVLRQPNSIDKLTIRNSGSMLAGSNVLIDNGSNATEEVFNSGIMVGAISLGRGNDTYDGTGGRLTGIVSGGPGNDTLKGGIDNDVFLGGPDNDFLDGGAGADSLTGNAGDDEYVVDNAADQVIELANEGIDRVQASVSFTLSGNVENLTLTGLAAINGTGNGLANTLVGNSAANVLDGGAGADSMTGGAGDDTYIVDNAGDTVAEGLLLGNDTILSSISLLIADNVENLVLTGFAALNGTGNGLNNAMTGNSADNVLDGGAGADAMAGGAGNDTYIVDNGSDSIIEDASAGTDSVAASAGFVLSANVENLFLTGFSAINGTGNGLDNAITGNGAANVLTGGGGNDTLRGGDGNDRLVGGSGIDQLFGGAGADRFDFLSRTDSTSRARDTIFDFSRTQRDKISLTAIDAMTTKAGDQAFQFKGLAGFTKTAGELIYGFSGATTIVSGDVNGDGVADFSFRLNAKVNLLASDFLL